MRKVVMTAMIIITLTVASIANPLMEKMVAFVNVDPPQIGLWCYEESDISGMMLETSQCTITINEGVIAPENYFNEPFILDSSNTSGFIICNESDYIEPVDDYWCEGVSFGQYRWYPAPISGHPITRFSYIDYDMPLYVMSFEDAQPGYSESEVLINEVSINNSWDNSGNFIELYNTGDQDIDISNWRIIVDDVFQIPDGTIIPTSGYYTLNASDFPENYDITPSADNIYLAKYADTGEYMIVDQVGWSSDHGENVSYMRYPDGDITNGSCWWQDAYLGHDDESSSYTFEDGFPTRGAANRHESPGFVPIAARADSIDEDNARISWTDPIWNEQFNYSVLVKSYDAYDNTPTDGDIIYTGTEQQYIDDDYTPDQIAYYTVFAYNVSGEYSTPTEESRTCIGDIAIGINDNITLPESYITLACYPNPFNAQAKIDFAITQPGKVQLMIYDITGRLIETLTDEYYSAGQHSIIWNAESYSSGIYFARLHSGYSSAINKMVLLK